MVNEGTLSYVWSKWVDLMKHHIKELGRDEKGLIPTIGLCNSCHEWHNRYSNALKAHGFDIDITK